MKILLLKIFLVLIFSISISSLRAQKGIGTNTPNPNTALEIKGEDKGILIPRVSLTGVTAFFNAVTATASDTGILVFNTNTTTASGLQGQGYYFWNNSRWNKFISKSSKKISSLACHAISFSNQLIVGSAADITASIPYTGGDSSSYNGGQSVASSPDLGVGGLTATLQGGVLSSGTGSLTFNITGTPQNSGIAYFEIDFGGEFCVLALPVNDLSTRGTAIVSSWDCNGLTTGVLTKGETVDVGVSKSITALVTKPGTYNISAISNGIEYTAMGTFLEMGSQTVILNGSGVPINSGAIDFTLNTQPNCNFTIMLDDPSTLGTGSVTSWGCQSGSLSGTLYLGENTLGKNITKTIIADVTRIGTYNFIAMGNGVTFAASGTFTNLGTQNVILTASGIPSDTGTHTYSLNTSPGCSSDFNIETISRSSGGTAILTVDCDVSTPIGSLYVGRAPTGVSQSIEVNVTKAGTYSINTAEINGITFSASGNLATGTQTVTLMPTGTPITNKENNIYVLNNNSQFCPFIRTVELYGLPDGLNITNIAQTKYIASIYDNNYLDVTDPVGSAALSAYPTTAGTDPLIDLQGSIGVLGSSNEILITFSMQNATSNNINYPSYTKSITIASEVIEGGGSPKDIIFSYPEGVALPGSNTVTATIYAPSTVNLKKLDVNSGVGNSAPYGYFIGKFDVVKDSERNTDPINLRIIAGIPDRAFGDGEHDFLYYSVKTTAGQVWLGTSLGATYNNIHSPYFEPKKQAQSSDDFLAFGSLYQWGRLSDGHELFIYTNAASGTFKYPTVQVQSNSVVPGHPNQIRQNSFTVFMPNFDWLASPTNNLWQGVNGVNNPCPNGFSVPDSTTLQNAIKTYDNTISVAAAFAGFLRLESSGKPRYSSSGNWLDYEPNAIALFTSSINTSNNRPIVYNKGVIGTLVKESSTPIRCVRL